MRLDDQLVRPQSFGYASAKDLSRVCGGAAASLGFDIMAEGAVEPVSCEMCEPSLASGTAFGQGDGDLDGVGGSMWTSVTAG